MKPDDEIRKNVLDEIQWDAQLTGIASQIGVTVKNEVVTLSGNVDYYSQKLAAENAAKRVKGVKFLAMDIVVRTAGAAAEMTDGKIADSIHNALVGQWAVNGDRINIKVEDGWVYLEGEVDWEFERSATQKAVENLRGVKGVINSIRIKVSQVDPADIEKKIKAAFRRHATVDAEAIHIALTNDKIVLTGKVRSWMERKDAEDVVWSTPGLTDVENKLEIEKEAYLGE